VNAKCYCVFAVEPGRRAHIPWLDL